MAVGGASNSSDPDDAHRGWLWLNTIIPEPHAPHPATNALGDRVIELEAYQGSSEQILRINLIIITLSLGPWSRY